MTTSRERAAVFAVFILPLVWLAAGIANFSASIYGDIPSLAGIITTFMAVLAWLMAGWSAGRFFESSLFVRLAAGFWVTVACAPIIHWLLTEGVPPQSLVYGVLLMLWSVIALPLYGLTADCPPWEPTVQSVVINAAGAQVSIIGLVAFAVTSLAFVAGRRGRRLDPASVSSGTEDATHLIM